MRLSVCDRVTWEPSRLFLLTTKASAKKKSRCEQDESIFKAYQKSLYQWVVHGIRGLRKKTDGPGEMVSGFKDEIRGFGHPITPVSVFVSYVTFTCWNCRRHTPASSVALASGGPIGMS